MKRLVFFAAALAVLGLALESAALADSPPATQGDAQAFFNATLNGGGAIRFQGGGMVAGAPLSGPRVRIRPFPGLGPQHVCASDWHVINIFVTDGGDSTFKREQAVADLSPLVFNYTLDGAPLAATVTPIKRAADGLAEAAFGLDVAYWEDAGAILPPTALSAGTHSVHLVIDNWFGPGIPEDFGAVTFLVDPAGTGACL